MEMGADRMLVKPMQTPVLIRQLEKLLESHAAKLAKISSAAAPASDGKAPAKKAAVKKSVTKKATKKAPAKKVVEEEGRVGRRVRLSCGEMTDFVVGPAHISLR